MSRKEPLHFSVVIENQIDGYIRNGKSVEDMVKAKYEIADIMDYDLDLKSLEHSDFGFRKVRGNVNLMQGNIRTFKEAQEIIDAAIKFSTSTPLGYTL